jgi:GWxTD domain-containing protein
MNALSSFLSGPILAGPIAEALSRTLFHFLWEGALIALTLALSIRVFRPSSASIRYGLACAAMLAMVAAFSATLAWCWPHAASVTIQSNAPRMKVPPPVPFARPETPPSAAPSRLNWIVPAWFVPAWIVPSWLLGAALFSLRSLTAWLAAMRLKRSGVCAAAEIWQRKAVELGERIRLSRPVALLESCLTDVPVVVGFLRPTILVPAALFTGFPPDQLEFILIHELAHIRRCDYLVNLLQSIVEDALFYHPAVWWVSSVIRAERENCCDDTVVAETHDARGFAEALASLEQDRWAAQEAVLAVNGGHLMNRIRRLLEGRDRPRLGFAPWAAPVFLVSLLPGLLTVMFAMAASAPHAQSADTAQPLLRVAPASPRPPVMVAQARPADSAQQPVARPAPAPAPPPAAQEESPYTRWLNEDAIYIISDEERRAFRALQTDEERASFIEQFWLRRDPTPDTVKNEMREEHYRRIAYANEMFSSGIPGWKTDRGMIYIRYGPPDERDEHPSGGAYERPIEEGGGQTQTFPFEKWRYRHIEGVGNDVMIEFVDTTKKGEFHITADPSEKDALLYVPGAGLTMYEQLGLASKGDRFTRTDGTRLGTGTMPLPASMDQFTRLEAFAQLQAPKPAVPPVMPPEGAIVEAVVFRGARRVAQDVLRNAIRTRPGDKVDKDALDRDLIALWSTKRFSDITLTFERGQTGWIVDFALTEIPVQPRN